MNENEMKSKSNESRIILTLFRNNELRFKDLQEKTGLSPPTLTKRLKAMEANGSITRVLHPGERWPYYKIASIELMQDLILPFAFSYEVTKKEKAIQLFFMEQFIGHVVTFLLSKEITTGRSHRLSINLFIEMTKGLVQGMIDDGASIEEQPPNLDDIYKRILKNKWTKEEREWAREKFKEIKEVQEKYKES